MSIVHVRWFRDAREFLLCNRLRGQREQLETRSQARLHQVEGSRCQRRRRVPDPRGRN